MSYIHIFLFVLAIFGSRLEACSYADPLESMDSVPLCIRGKVYLDADRLINFEDQLYLVVDETCWLLIEELQYDEEGYFVNFESPKCPKGHDAFKRCGGPFGYWLCMDPKCPYYFITHKP